MDDLRRLVERTHEDVDTDRTMGLLRRLVRHDRYQASHGVHAAAALVATAAEEAGLVDVEILRLPADGSHRWWTFTAPVGWTPHSASLALADGGPPLMRYPEQPYGLAAYSAPTPPGGVELPLVRWPDDPPHEWPDGALVLHAGPPGPDLVPLLLGHRARAVAVGNEGPVRRLELPHGTELSGFSVPPAAFARLDRARRAGGGVRVAVRAEQGPDTMPVVTARTPGGTVPGAHALVTAHLCHPAPGANDNASGVCTALETGRLLAARAPRRPVRFVWAPEIVGTAAYAHTAYQLRGDPLPFAAVNLDMTGEDQRLCGSPLIVERSPQHLPSCLTPVVEECVRALPPAGRSFSGAVGCDTWAWRATPFTGASDHGVLADRSLGIPSVQLGHWPDRFHHSDADSVDKTDPAELRRSAAVAASALTLLCEAHGEDGPVGMAELAALTARWGARRLAERLPAPGAPEHSRTGRVDPFAAEHAEAALERTAAVAAGALTSLEALGADPGLTRRWADRLPPVAAALSPLAGTPMASGTPTAPGDGRVYARAWPGPFNLRALLSDSTAEDRAWFLERMAEDERGWYARAMSLAQGVDGAAHETRLIEHAALDSLLSFDVAEARRFLHLMLRAGWTV
ncbi:DUF4910 domain-containing protein [Streptomyces daliensis]|uniref:DUF4910 domain-containing protein n=1 Tax=Streptomyces daliensis TaxID=299421 RepID=A0A8T4ITU0_9ACTN|nr:DUF4910 domain-containing protein [Streptomyces daliensis]